MRTVHVPRLNREVSALGFGCASLGSRISENDGRRAISCAIDLGVSWFDVAPPYGDGHAEALLGQSLRGRRADVVICTKFGIAPPQIPLAARLIRPLARKVISAVPQLRTAAARARPLGQRLPIDPNSIEASVTRSLRLLGTDYIDVLALHEPSVSDAVNSEIFDVVHRLVERGQVRAVSIAGHPESIEAAIKHSMPVDIAQFPDTPFTSSAPVLRKRLSEHLPMFVTHGVFGSNVAQQLGDVGAPVRESLNAITKRHGFQETAWPHDLLLQFALSNNPDGVVILSMFNLKHIERNATAARLPPSADFAADIRQALTSQHAEVTSRPAKADQPSQA